ncbi:MAG: PadR family transcriptional regulator [Gemmatimonadetes bacterium]|nr:PadR family transcriptional regulator [Gemmatimonadota bacterium]
MGERTVSLKHILLGLLREPATGYDLKATFNETISHFWSAELGQIYPTLRRLEGEGLLHSRVEPSEKGPNRRVYSLTDEGREELSEWLRGGPVVGVERFAYLAQVFFMDTVGDLHETRAFMAALRQRLNEWLARLRAIETDITGTYGSAPEHYPDAGFHQFATLRMGIRSIGSKVEWCDETLAAIDRRLTMAPPGDDTGECRTLEETR